VYELGGEAEKHLAYNGIQEENIIGLSVGSVLQFGHVPGGGVGAVGRWPAEATATSLA
jgi:hypothetical protein